MGNNIRELRVAKGLTMRELGDRMDVHYTTIAKIERSQRKLTADWIMKFSAALEVEATKISDDAAYTNVAPTRTVPIIGMVAAGNWREAIQHPEGHAFAVSGGKQAFGLRVDGDSMDKVVPAGGIVIIDPEQFDLHEGSYYVVMNGEGDTTFKRYRSNPARLEPCSSNDSHEVMALGRDPFNIVGRVVGMYSDL